MKTHYNNSVGSFLGGIFGHTQSLESKEVNTLVNLANEPVSISPLVYIIPILSIAVFGVIYFSVLKK
jgi:hypothetical protein